MTDFNFNVGDKIRLHNWGKGSTFQVRFIDDRFVFGYGQDGYPEVYSTGMSWILCEEHKPDFDWLASGFWAKEKVTTKITVRTVYFSKINDLVWFLITESGGFLLVDAEWCKASIIRQYEPSDPPDWAHLIEKCNTSFTLKKIDGEEEIRIQ